MKKTFLIGLSALFFAACSNNSSNKVEAGDAQEVAQAEETALALTVDTEASSIAWKGTKLLGGSHVGTVNISEGVVKVENGVVIEGNFTVDMTSIKNEDVEDEEYRGKLEGHLKSNDFFNVEAYPTSTFAITSVNVSPDENGNTHNISGNLTIRGVEKNITFPAKVVVSENGLDATATFTINRLDWGVSFDEEGVKNFLAGIVTKGKDDFVKNEVELTVRLIAK